MNARGLQTTPRALIGQLRSNLLDRYPRESIFKELVQNAEDARASRLDLGWTPGLPGASHPLLKGPGLIVLNDGKFDQNDAEAIGHFGLNFKATDRASIGKFGLGLKSVFHLCEAFFYLSSTLPQGRAGEPPYNSLVNPWYGTQFHEDWNDFPEPLLCQMRSYLAPLLPNEDRGWFCLWIPLRRVNHCQGCTAIYKDYPGDLSDPPEDLFTPDLTDRLAGMLPLLRRLREMRVWQLRDECNSPPELKFTVRLAPSTSRCRHPETFDECQPVAGVVEVVDYAASEGPRRIPFAGQEAWISELNDFRGRDGWPESFSLDESGAGTKEKSEPHCAAAFAAFPCVPEQAGLAIVHAVFLPLTRPVVEEIRFSGGWRVSLLLHGFFFVDPGRGDIMTPALPSAIPEQSAETRIRREWNYRLLDVGSYPLVLPALERLVTEAPLPSEFVKELTRAIAKALAQARDQSQTYKEQRLAVCRAGRWLHRWAPSSTGWTLVPGSATVHEIPDPPGATPDLPCEVFPRLCELADARVLTPSGWPRLAEPDQPDPWPDEFLAELLDIQAPSLFEGGERLRMRTNLREFT